MRRERKRTAYRRLPPNLIRPVRVVGSVNKFVAGDTLGARVLASEKDSVDIAWYYATPEGDVEITEARGLLSYAPTNPKHDVKVVVTGTGLSEGSASEALFVYSGDYTVETNYDPASKTLQVQVPEVDGAVKYYIWKPAPSVNMAIYQRTTEPVFTVGNLQPGQTTNFRVSAYDAKGKVLNSKDFKFASVALNAPEKYEAGKTLDVAVAADPSLNYDLSWFYVTPNDDVEISEAKDQTSFIPDAATYPIKIVATPIAGSEGFCVGAPVEAIVDPYVVPQFGINDPYDTTKRSFVTSWSVVSGATRYAVQKMNANGQWVKMTAFDFVDGQIVGDTRAALSEDGTQFSYSVNMVKIGVEETYRVVALDAKGVVVESGEFTYNPVGLTVENDAYDLANGTQPLRAATVQGGGAIYAVDGSSVAIYNSTFTNNTAGRDGNGGAIWLDASSTLEVENSTFTPDGASNLSGNVTTSKGSAIWKDDSVVSSALLDDAFVELEEEIELFF